jgi:hypothetical protein
MTNPITRAAPATEPSVKADFSSPMAALRTNKLALKAGDAATLKRCYYTPDAQEQKAIDTIVSSFAIQVRFQDVCAQRFGNEAAERVAPGFNLRVPANAREEIEGDHATLFNVGGPTPTTLQRVNGEWRFTYASLVDNNFRDLPRLPADKLVAVFQTGIDMYQSLCDDVAGGRFERMDDAIDALRARKHDRGKKIQQIIGETQ